MHEEDGGGTRESKESGDKEFSFQPVANHHPPKSSNSCASEKSQVSDWDLSSAFQHGFRRQTLDVNNDRV